MPGKLHVFERQTLIPRPRAEIFPFFSDPRNLEKLTPPFLRFRVKSDVSGGTFEGQVIDYGLRLHGLPLGWRTLITQWDPPHKFVDLAVSSPYACWHHTHTFEDRGSETLMTDRVLWQLPLSPLSDWLAAWMVKRDVGRIFDYRTKVLSELYGARELKPGA